jgi:predicted ATPase
VEQVAGVAKDIVAILGESPGLTVLATSREALHVRVERVLNIPPLDLPPSRIDRPLATDIGVFDSVRLFVDRARAVRPGFELTDENAMAIAEICRRLDGLPLAIELCAARIRLFSPDVLLVRLGDRFGLLRGGTRDLPERQQTLRAAMDWSYDLLDPAERLLFEILGVFAEADVVAIEAVTQSIGVVDGATVDAIDGLASLVDKSLVRNIDNAGAEPRITMLETIREFARDRLAQRPELQDRARHEHAVFYSALAARLRPELSGNRRQTALAALAADSANLRLCWSYWVAASDLNELNQLAGPLMTLDDGHARRPAGQPAH